jgi:predicted O-methyltransferase YrrM
MTGQAAGLDGTCDTTDAGYAARSAAFYSESTRPQMDDTMGEVVPIWAIDAVTGRFLYELTREVKPRLSIEIGLCQAASAMHFASAHAANSSGLHIAIDPFQAEYFRDQGKISICRLGLDPWFTLLRTRSDRALPLLHMAGLTAEILFIDGDHRFDAVFTDYYFADKILQIGSYLIFDEGGYDCPTKRVSAFIAANMPNYERLPSPERLYVFRKLGPDERSFADATDF